MAFSMDVDELNREEVLQPLQPEPEVKEKIETQAESNVKEVMDVDLDSLAQRREITSMIDGFGTDIVRRSSEKNELLSTTLGTLSKQGGESSQVVNSLSELDLCVFRNDETTPEQAIPLTEFMENVDSYISVTSNLSLGDDGLSVPISEGDTVWFALRAKDSFGNISYNLVDGHKLTAEKLLHLGFQWRDSLSTRWTPGDISTYTFSNL